MMENLASHPPSHSIATVEDLTDMLDYGFEDLDGIDDDAEEEQGQNPPLTGRGMVTSSYDVYIVDTPKETNDDDKEDPVEDKPPETQPIRRCQRRHSKSRHAKDSNTGTGANNTPDDAENNEDLAEVTFEQEEQETGKLAPTNRPSPMTRRTVVTDRSPRMR